MEDLLIERGIDICQEMVRLWWNRLGRCPQVKSGASGWPHARVSPLVLVLQRDVREV